MRVPQLPAQGAGGAGGGGGRERHGPAAVPPLPKPDSRSCVLSPFCCWDDLAVLSARRVGGRWVGGGRASTDLWVGGSGLVRPIARNQQTYLFRSAQITSDDRGVSRDWTGRGLTHLFSCTFPCLGRTALGQEGKECCRQAGVSRLCDLVWRNAPRRRRQPTPAQQSPSCSWLLDFAAMLAFTPSFSGRVLPCCSADCNGNAEREWSS